MAKSWGCSVSSLEPKSPSSFCYPSLPSSLQNPNPCSSELDSPCCSFWTKASSAARNPIVRILSLLRFKPNHGAELTSSNAELKTPCSFCDFYKRFSSFCNASLKLLLQAGNKPKSVCHWCCSLKLLWLSDFFYSCAKPKSSLKWLNRIHQSCCCRPQGNKLL